MKRGMLKEDGTAYFLTCYLRQKILFYVIILMNPTNHSDMLFKTNVFLISKIAEIADTMVNINIIKVIQFIRFCKPIFVWARKLEDFADAICLLASAVLLSSFSLSLSESA